MTRVSDTYKWDEMCDLTDEDMENLLKFYETSTVPPIDVLKSMRNDAGLDKIDLFDGSFGFSVGA
jgi:precorrin-2 dehydrogenase / sirohydrochlorin ferrochelatase